MNLPPRGAQRSELLIVALLFAAVTFVLAFPLSLHPASQVIPAGSDNDLTLWIFGWDVHALLSRPWSMFNGNIYYPYDHTLAYAENLIGSALLTAPIVWLTGNLVLAVNTISLLSCALCGFGTYLLARRLGYRLESAIIAGLIFAFAVPRFFRIGQLHLTAVQWIPLCLASLYGYLQTGRRRDLLLACALFTLQAYTSGHAAVFLAVSILLFIVWHVALGESVAPLRRARDLGVSGAVTLLLVLPLVLPYRAVQREMGLRRSLREAYLFAPTPESFFASPAHVDKFLNSFLFAVPPLDRANAVLFPGYLTLLLAAIGIWSINWRAPRDRRVTAWMVAAWLAEGVVVILGGLAIAATLFGGFRIRFDAFTFSAREPLRLWLQCFAAVAIRVALVRRVPFDMAGRASRTVHNLVGLGSRLRSQPAAFFLALGLFTLWLSLGPAYGLYGWAVNWPGFSFIRVPSRFTIITLLCVGILAAAGVEWLTSAWSDRKRRLVSAVAALTLVAEFAASPLALVPYSTDAPALDRWLNTVPKPFVVAEVPVTERLQGTYMLHSMAHWQRTVHGFSGMRPDLHSALYEEMASFPDQRSLESLANVGVTYVVVHADYYAASDWTNVEQRLAEFSGWLSLEHTEAGGRVYRLHRPVVMNAATTRRSE